MFLAREQTSRPRRKLKMWNYDAVIDRRGLRGLNGIEIAHLISITPRHDRLSELDERTLKDIGFDNSSR